MTWNWELPDWPNFVWDTAKLVAIEQQFLRDSGVFIGTSKHLKAEDQDQLRVEFLSSEALTTSEIEGEILDRASVQSSIRKQLGISGDSRLSTPAEQGISEMTVDLYRTYAEPLSEETLFAWHRMLFKGRNDLIDIGRYRAQADPMQVVSAGLHLPKVHFEAPPSQRVKAEAAGFISWFNRTAPEGPEPLPALTRAGTAHLYFESIHPFEDGNGRIGRAISDKALAQAIGEPTFVALSATILNKRKSYYQALEAGSHSNEITTWLLWFAATALEAQHRTTRLVEFLIAKTRMFDRLSGELNERQERALLRVFREGIDGFAGGLSAANYMKITGASPATTTRDLADLVALGALSRVGEHRHARYLLILI